MDNKVYSKKNMFKKNSTLKLNFMLKKTLLKTSSSSILLLNTLSNEQFIMIVNSKISLEQLVKISRRYPKNRILFKPLQSGSCIGLNPFTGNSNSNSKEYGYLISKHNNYDVLKNVLQRRQINLLEFKSSLKSFLRHYSKLNRDIGFKYNNINPESLLFRPNVFVLIDFKHATFNEKMIRSNPDVKKLTVQNLRNTSYEKKTNQQSYFKNKTKNPTFNKGSLSDSNKIRRKKMLEKQSKLQTNKINNTNKNKLTKNNQKKPKTFLNRIKKTTYNTIKKSKEDISKKLQDSQNDMYRKPKTNNKLKKTNNKLKKTNNKLKKTYKDSISKQISSLKKKSLEKTIKSSSNKTNLSRKNDLTKRSNKTISNQNSFFDKMTKQAYGLVEQSKKNISKKLQDSQNDFSKKITKKTNVVKKKKSNIVKRRKNLVKRKKNLVKRQSNAMKQKTKLLQNSLLRKNTNKTPSNSTLKSSKKQSNLKGGKNKKLYNYNKFKNIDKTFDITKYKELDNNDNYEIICILWLISISEKYLNNIPKGLILSKEDISNLKNTQNLCDKLDYLLKLEYFKFM